MKAIGRCSVDCTTLNKGVATKQIGHVRHAYTRPVLQSIAHRQRPLKHLIVRAGDIEKEEDNWEGLLPEEDEEIPGTYKDAMSSNTELGKAIKSVCNELDTLGELERNTLEEANSLLQKLGYKGSLFDMPESQESEDGK